jgi:hypothetical protein
LWIEIEEVEVCPRGSILSFIQCAWKMKNYIFGCFDDDIPTQILLVLYLKE